MRRNLPIIITFVIGSIVIINSFFVIPGLNNIVTNYLSRTSVVSMSWAVCVGAISLMRTHTRKISRKSDNWQYSIVLVACFAFFLVFGLVVLGHQSNPFYAFVFSSVQPPLSSTTFAIVCFYLASAAFRAFRIRSLEASLMMLSAFVVMLGAIPIGEAIWSGFPAASEFITNAINTSSLRAITIGVTLGALTQSMRVLVGIERGHLSE